MSRATNDKNQKDVVPKWTTGWSCCVTYGSLQQHKGVNVVKSFTRLCSLLLSLWKHRPPRSGGSCRVLVNRVNVWNISRMKETVHGTFIWQLSIINTFTVTSTHCWQTRCGCEVTAADTFTHSWWHQENVGSTDPSVKLLVPGRPLFHRVLSSFRSEQI